MVTEGCSEDAETRVSKVSRERLLAGQTLLARMRPCSARARRG